MYQYIFQYSSYVLVVCKTECVKNYVLYLFCIDNALMICKIGWDVAKQKYISLLYNMGEFQVGMSFFRYMGQGFQDACFVNFCSVHSSVSNCSQIACHMSLVSFEVALSYSGSNIPYFQGTLGSGINVAQRLLIFGFFPRAKFLLKGLR